MGISTHLCHDRAAFERGIDHRYRLQTAGLGRCIPIPMVMASLEHDRTAMAPRDPAHEVYDAACDLLQAARAIEQAAGRGGVLEAIPATLGTLEEALQVLSASCYRLAGECASSAPRKYPQRPRDQGATEQRLSRENEAFLMATLHDVGSSVARASRASWTGREITAPADSQDTQVRSTGGRHERKGNPSLAPSQTGPTVIRTTPG